MPVKQRPGFLKEQLFALVSTAPMLGATATRSLHPGHQALGRETLGSALRWMNQHKQGSLDLHWLHPFQ